MIYPGGMPTSHPKYKEFVDDRRSAIEPDLRGMLGHLEDPEQEHTAGQGQRQANLLIWEADKAFKFQYIFRCTLLQQAKSNHCCFRNQSPSVCVCFTREEEKNRGVCWYTT